MAGLNVAHIPALIFGSTIFFLDTNGHAVSRIEAQHTNNGDAHPVQPWQYIGHQMRVTGIGEIKTGDQINIIAKCIPQAYVTGNPCGFEVIVEVVGRNLRLGIQCLHPNKLPFFVMDTQNGKSGDFLPQLEFVKAILYNLKHVDGTVELNSTSQRFQDEISALRLEETKETKETKSGGGRRKSKGFKKSKRMNKKSKRTNKKSKRINKKSKRMNKKSKRT